MANPLPPEIKIEQTLVEDRGYYASCDYVYKEVWDQGDYAGNCMAIDATHMMTIVLRKKTEERDLLLSPDAIIAYADPVYGIGTSQLEEILRDHGIEDRFHNEAVRSVVPNHNYDISRRRRWKIAKFDEYNTLSTIVMALKGNFGPNGPQYPVLACCERMEPLTSDEAAQTSMSEPFRFGTYNSRLDNYSDALNFRWYPPNGYVMLITGMYTIRDQPNLLDHSFEVRNSSGKKWGLGGKVWLTADFFSKILIPVMKGDNLAYDFETCMDAEAAEEAAKLAAEMAAKLPADEDS
ncbi:uncharacterized protein LOC110914736 [Helianthus annuus]|uniref:uncharacterized protein LOC110914736 n=1 Tax=Helianthus annuus TaxID=4232 RepID=UPI000B904B6D|nr:uncharacterized protein LOC110914736 [Helianthus annuus]